MLHKNQDSPGSFSVSQDTDPTKILNKMVNDTSAEQSSSMQLYPNAKPLIEIPDGSQPVQLGSGVVTRILGHGGMANVYEIWNDQLEIFKAVKLMHPSAGRDSLERFQTEMKICAKLSHPNIVEIHGVGEWQGLPYIEMERIEGITLENLLTTRGSLPAQVVIAAGILACRGLAFAHNHEYQLYGKNYHGVVHRDLKPSNIMFCNDGKVKLMDFGIARPLDASLHTVDGGVVGTLQYLSPEQLNGENLDVRTDIYSLGELLYEALCGYQTFPEKNVTTLLNDKSKNRYKPLTEFQIDAPPQLIRLLHKAMSRDREHRVTNATEFGIALKSIGSKIGIREPQDIIRQYLKTTIVKQIQPQKKRAANIFILPIIFCFIIAAIIVSIYLLKSSHENESVSSTPVTVKINDTLEATIKNGISDSSFIPERKPDTPKAITKNLDTIIRQTEVKNANSLNKKTVKIKVKQEKPGIVQNNPDRHLTEIELLQQETGISEPQSLIPILFESVRYKDVITVYNASTPAIMTPKLAVMTLRSQIALNNHTALDRFLASVNIHDAEFYLSRARRALEDGSNESVISLINSAESAPHVLLSYDELKREVCFVKALLATAIFDKKHDELSYKDALDKWRELRASFAGITSHKYLQLEKEERKRMSQVYASVKE